MRITKFVTPEIIFGAGALSQVGECLLRLGARKVFIGSDPGVLAHGWVERVVHHLKQHNLEYHLWTSASPNPKDFEVHAGVEAYLNAECNAVLGIGGGSAIDAAKAIALLGSNGGTIHQYEGVDKIKSPLPPMVMVPTTAGSGSEVSQFSIIVDTNRSVKMTIVSKSLIPDIAIVDPETLTTKDRRLTANTGMDVLTHGIESYVSLAATPLTEVYSLQAIRLVARYLRPSTACQSNHEAKAAMAMASLQAGMAFSNAILGAVHAISHQLGGMLDTPHGEVNAILLPYVMQYNCIACPEKYGKIAEAFGEPVAGCSSTQAAKRAIEAVRELADDLDIPTTLSTLGLRDEQIAILSHNAVKDVCMVTNPRDMSEDDVAALLRQAM
ncbi:1,3-propanediol dehydrogenase [Alicyclobacillus contaminans]|uniref:iron-containing alcohol dehydrogenase n=1 Tax=Alicyclobacillus contaminans TaxID=392016 RepID=UPI00040D3D1D|nr:iron-containing alcohol dehydrogenase [Alicyclobacillus contaminans]GMA51614.1 1,3-propanediol dehydrogenase [Alicyclobacillus contaminans]